MGSPSLLLWPTSSRKTLKHVPWRLPPGNQRHVFVANVLSMLGFRVSVRVKPGYIYSLFYTFSLPRLWLPSHTGIYNYLPATTYDGLQ